MSKVATDQRVGTAFALPPDFVLANYPNAEEMAEGAHVECLAKRAGVVEWTPKNSKQPRRLPRFDFFEPPPQKKQ